ncbi:hypothetical protein, partial [Burkholderia sp. Ac-20345]|uniref:hypothetical protein n=1 Tax=Burkholderia sp. Ac-20345 TaxID=2703891 RepID=UPI00197BE9FC
SYTEVAVCSGMSHTRQPATLYVRSGAAQNYWRESYNIRDLSDAAVAQAHGIAYTEETVNVEYRIDDIVLDVFFFFFF